MAGKAMTGIALLGAGRIGQVHARAIEEAGATLISVFDVMNEAAKAFGEKSGAAICESAEAAINHPGVDGVLVATSTDTHVDLILAAASAGKAVMCEKPIAPSLSEAQRCVDGLGDKVDRVFIGFNRRFDDGHNKVNAGVLRGEIGSLEQLTITSRDPFPPPMEYIPVSGGLYRDMMIHDFDIARWMLGEEIVKISAEGGVCVDPEIGKLGDIDTAMVTMISESGKQVVILNSRRAVYGYDQRIEAFGARGMLISDNPSATSVKRFSAGHFAAPDAYATFFMDRYTASYRREIEAFVNMIEKGEKPPINAVDGLMASYLAEAATVSRLIGKPITLDVNGKQTWDTP
ncbi:MAG: inositol 2-dehydrogenase [Hyphomicrobiales bacterium]